METREYHKIKSPFKRAIPDGLMPTSVRKFTFLDRVWTDPAFEYLEHAQWRWTEKIDGTNVRIVWNGEKVVCTGRTNSAQMPGPLMYNVLLPTFTPALLGPIFPDIAAGGDRQVTLVGEGFGAGIQKCGIKYGAVAFRLFDVFVDNGDRALYLEHADVVDIAAKCGVQTAPVVATCSLAEAMKSVAAGMKSTLGDLEMEGWVGRPLTEMQNRFGERVIVKVKTTDFKAEQ